MVRHILKDGRVLTDITGHVVRGEDAKEVYAMLRKEYTKHDNKIRAKGVDEPQR